MVAVYSDFLVRDIGKERREAQGVRSGLNDN